MPALSTLTKAQINTMWDEGFRPYEIYTCNPYSIEYFGEWKLAGEISGWEIKHVFANKENLKNYPLFDEIIMLSDISACDEYFK